MKFKVLNHIEDLELGIILYPGEIIEREGKRAEVFKAKADFFEVIPEEKKPSKATKKA